MEHEKAILELRPSWITIGGACVMAVMIIVIVRMWALQQARNGGMRWDLAVPIGIMVLAIVQGYWSLRPRKLVLTPTSFSIVTDASAKIVPWSDVEAIVAKKIWVGRGSALGTVILRKTGGAIKLQDIYSTRHEEVYRFLTDYAAIHAPGVITRV